MRLHALVLAGGSGARFGGELPKQLLRLAGEPILARSVRAMLAGGIDSLVVVAHPAWLPETEAVVNGLALTVRSSVVPGGATRSESARHGLAALEAAADDVVLIHDAARPLASREVVLRSIEPLRAGRADAVEPVIPTRDTIVVVDGDRVVEIPERGPLRRVQTPQAFRVAVIRRAYEAATAADDLRATDDCSLVLRHVPAARIVAVPGDELNIKITTTDDLALAERLLDRPGP